GTSSASFSPRCASPGNGSTPALTAATTCGLTSTPTTSCEGSASANCTASGRPILPSATTAIFIWGFRPVEGGGQVPRQDTWAGPTYPGAMQGSTLTHTVPDGTVLH